MNIISFKNYSPRLPGKYQRSPLKKNIPPHPAIQTWPNESVIWFHFRYNSNPSTKQDKQINKQQIKLKMKQEKKNPTKPKPKTDGHNLRHIKENPASTHALPSLRKNGLNNDNWN